MFPQGLHHSLLVPIEAGKHYPARKPAAGSTDDLRCSRQSPSAGPAADHH